VIIISLIFFGCASQKDISKKEISLEREIIYYINGNLSKANEYNELVNSLPTERSDLGGEETDEYYSFIYTLTSQNGIKYKVFHTRYLYKNKPSVISINKI
jgi:hypothetical protein